MDLSRSDREYVAERAGGFVGRDWVFERVRSFLSGPPGTFVLRGDPGAGKTAVAARLALASSGLLGAADPGPAPVGAGVISAAVFCRAGKATVPELAQRLCDQLAASVDGFAAALTATAEAEHGVTIGNVRVEVRGDVHAGGTVSGVVLRGEHGTLAFTTGVAAPLRLLRDQGAATPVVVLADAVDEAAGASEVNHFARLLANLDGVHLIVTCRPAPAVLTAFRNAEHTVDLIAHAPAGDDDVRRYVRDRLAGHGPIEAIEVLAGRVCGEAAGNFLYAYYVTGMLVRSESLAGLDEAAARLLPLPTGGLAGVYEEFLDRQIAGDETKWAEQLSPVLAPVCLALGDGFTTAQLGAIAARLTGRHFSLDRTRHVTRAAGQFLDGQQPDGPFRVYHQSFARFLTDPAQNPNWPIDLTETNGAVAAALMPQGRVGARDWRTASDYARRHLAAHAAAAGILDDLLLDPGYLLAAHPPGLLAFLSEARSPAARLAAAAYRRVVHRLADSSEPARASYLLLAALQAGAGELFPAASADTGHGAKRHGWLPTWAWWRPATPSQALGRDVDEILALSAVETRSGSTLALVGRRSGAVEAWDLTLGQSIARWRPDGVTAVQKVTLAELAEGPALVAAWFGAEIGVFQLASERSYLLRDEGRVTAMCVTERAGQPVCVTAHDDGRLVMRTLPELDVATEIPDATMANIYGLAVVTHHGERVLLSAGDSLDRGGKGTDTSMLRMWSLDDLSLLWEDHLARAGVLFHIEKHDLAGRPVTVISQEGWGPFQLWDLNQGTLLLDGDHRTNHVWACEHEGNPYVVEADYGTLTARAIEVPTNDEPAALILGSSVGPIETEGDKFSSIVRVHGRATLLSATGGAMRIWDLHDLLREALSAGSPAADARPSVAQPVYVLAWGKARPGELYAGAGDRVFALDAGTGSFLWDRELSHEGRDRAFVKALALTPSQDQLVAADDDGCLHVLDPAAQGQAQYVIKLGGTLERLCVASWQRQTLGFATLKHGDAWGVRVWDLDSRQEVPTRSAYQLWAGEEDKILRGLAVAPCATRLRFAFASTYGKVMVADLGASGAERKSSPWAYDEWHIPDSDGGNVSALAASGGEPGLGGADHELLLAAGTGGTIAIWNFLDGTLLATRPRAHLGVIRAMQFSHPAGQPVLATGGDDGVLRIWTAGLNELVRVEIGEPIHALTFLGTDRIAVGGQRGLLMLRLLEGFS